MAALTQTLLLTSPRAVTTMDAPGSQQVSAISALTTGLARGDEEAFRQFHDKYFDRLLRYQLVVTRGHETAARDALQETFLRVVRHARKFDDEKTFWSWLTVLARSAACDSGRKQQRYWNLLADYARSLFAPASMDSEINDADLRLQKFLDESLNELGFDDRSLIEGKYLRCASVRELADETGLTEKAIESRLLRARRELRENILQKIRYENIV